MKFRSILFALALGATALVSAQGVLKAEHKYTVGSVDEYTMKMNLNSSAGEITMSSGMKQTVKKVYDNGDADIETTTSDMIVNVAGQEIRPPGGKPTVMKMSKFGVPLSSAAGARAGMNFAQFGSMLGGKDLKVGEAYTFDEPNKDNPKNHAKGSVKLLSIDGGKAKISIVVDTFTEGSDKPMHLEGTSTVMSDTGAMYQFEGKVTNLPKAAGGPGMAIDSATFSITHK